MFRRGSGGKNYVVRSVQTANISNDTAFREFVVHEFGNKVCGEAKNMEIGYFKGNKHVWIRTTIQKFWGNCVVEVQLHCGVNVHLGESEL